MVFNVLSLAPLGAELVKALIQQTPDLPDFEVVFGHEMNTGELKMAIKSADIVLGDYTFHQAITEEILESAHRLKFIQQPSVGYQHIDIDACTKRGIFVANTAGANTVSVAEHTVACGLCLMKNLFLANKSVKEGRWEQMNIKPVEILDKTWGIVGFGRIGRSVAERLRPFCLSRILYFDIQHADVPIEQELGVEFCEFGELLRQADIVSIHAPLNESTRMLIDKDALSIMKRTAFLINVARAELVDEEALCRALNAGEIAGAAVDVFSTEPISPDNPLLGVESDKLILSPHVAGVSDEAAGRIINMASSNIARFMKGLIPDSLVNII